MSDAASLLFARFGEPLKPHPILDDPHLVRMLGRRTHRQYRPEPVEPCLVDSLLHLAFCASAKSDFQQASVIVVEDPERRSKIADLVPSMPWIGAAPVFLVFCADAARLQKISLLRDRPTPNANLEAFFNATVDAALVMQTFILAAEHAGLGCCPISVIRDHLPEVARVLRLPERVLPVAGLCVGYPAGEGHISMRLPTKVTRHVDGYDDESLAQKVDEYDRRRAPASPDRPQQPLPPDDRANPTWSEAKAQQALAGEGSAFGAMVRASGFTLA
jgi:nitroreductase